MALVFSPLRDGILQNHQAGAFHSRDLPRKTLEILNLSNVYRLTPARFYEHGIPLRVLDYNKETG